MTRGQKIERAIFFLAVWALVVAYSYVFTR
jgi:hypothetical protein